MENNNEMYLSDVQVSAIEHFERLWETLSATEGLEALKNAKVKRILGSLYCRAFEDGAFYIAIDTMKVEWENVSKAIDEFENIVENKEKSMRYEGKAIYNPDGKAGEYARWGCNLFKGCSNGCSYCYLKKGILKKGLGGDKPELKKCLVNEDKAFEIFKKELSEVLPRVAKEGGLFFSFTTDPMLPETLPLTLKCSEYALSMGVPVTILTKCAWWTSSDDVSRIIKEYKDKLCIGFTLTGHDELEPSADLNAERIEAMEWAKNLGAHTFASIEPVVDFPASLDMVRRAAKVCDLFKIGLMSGVKKGYYEKVRCEWFIRSCEDRVSREGKKIYWKESICKLVDPDFEFDADVAVGSKYNLFLEE